MTLARLLDTTPLFRVARQTPRPLHPVSASYGEGATAL